LVLGLLKQKVPHLLKENGGRFQASESWLKKLIRVDMKLVMRKSTTGRALPDDWEMQVEDLAKRLAIVTFTHDIPPSLVVNADQTGWPLAPSRGNTLAKKGAKEVAVIGKDDKRQVTLLLGCSAAGDMVPPQLILKGKREKSLPPMAVRIKPEFDGWLFSLNPINTWSSLTTMKEWVQRVLAPYFDAKRKELGLKSDQKAVLILDCWSVHKSAEFRNFLRVEYGNIILLYVPACCTSKGQVVDLILNWPMKSASIKEFEAWLSQQVTGKLDRGVALVDIKIDLSMTTLRPLIPSMIYVGYKAFVEEKEKVLVGWRRAGLLRAWDPLFRRSATMEAARLFPGGGNETVVPEGEEEQLMDKDDYGVEERLAALITNHYSSHEHIAPGRGRGRGGTSRGRGRGRGRGKRRRSDASECEVSSSGFSSSSSSESEEDE
jgi:hypothetical protein